MPKIEYLDPEIANEGQRADAAFVAPVRPHVWDYAQLKEHPTYGKYFAPKAFSPWPAWIYNHKTGESKVVDNPMEASQHGVQFNRNLRHPDYQWTGDWQAEPPKDKAKPSINDTGKSVVTASAERATADSMTKILQQLVAGKSPDVAPEISAAISQDQEYQDYLAFKRAKAAASAEPVASISLPDEKEILIGLAKEKNIHVDKRWGLDKIKSALDEAGAD